jgi:hypothetical protein
MAETEADARRHLHQASNQREEKAAAFWQQAVNYGRALRQARAEMQVTQTQTQQRADKQEAGASRRQRSR